MVTMTKPAKLTKLDVEAMERAIEMGRARGKAEREQLDEMLKNRPWHRVGEFAAYGCQCETLGLKPWQTPPCELTDPDAYASGDDHRGLRAAARLLERLQDLGLSKYEPDPLHAIETKLARKDAARAARG
jgi:hypothetical protein